MRAKTKSLRDTLYRYAWAAPDASVGADRWAIYYGFCWSLGITAGLWAHSFLTKNDVNRSRMRRPLTDSSEFLQVPPPSGRLLRQGMSPLTTQ